MQAIAIPAIGFCSCYQTTEAVEKLFHISIKQERDSLKDFHARYLVQKQSVASCREQWPIKAGEVWLNSLRRQRQSLRRGPSETLVLSDNQY